MPFIKLKVPCTIENKTANDIYGEATFASARPSKCAVVSLSRGKADSTVRTDSGGTRGHADELVADAKLLMSDKEIIAPDDVIVVHGVRIIVMGVKFQFDTQGKLDHLQIVGTIE
jgi:hypothetical protein